MKSIIKEVIRKLQAERNKSEIAAWFHVQMVLMIQAVASNQNCHKICFSGGVFQNGLLVDLLIKIMGEQHQLYFNRDLSPNDENISFGQLMRYLI